jgi:hypothetical protein
MRGILRLAVVVLFLMGISQVAPAQENPGAQAAPNGTGKTVTPEQFQERKARILKMIEARKAMLDKATSCVEAAANNDELRKCRPERPEGMGPGGMRRGGRGKRYMEPMNGPSQ